MRFNLDGYSNFQATLANPRSHECRKNYWFCALTTARYNDLSAVEPSLPSLQARAMLKRRTAASHFETHWELEDQDRVDFSTFSYRISKVPARLEIIDDNQKRYSFRWTDCSLIESPHHEFISMIFTDKTVAITGEYLHTMMARDADSLVHPSLWASLNAQSTVRIAPSRGESVGANRTHCISNILIEDRK